MEIYSPRKYRQISKTKNTIKSEAKEAFQAFDEEVEGEFMQELKEKARERFYNVMQYLFEVEEVRS